MSFSGVRYVAVRFIRKQVEAVDRDDTADLSSLRRQKY